MISVSANNSFFDWRIFYHYFLLSFWILDQIYQVPSRPVDHKLKDKCKYLADYRILALLHMESLLFYHKAIGFKYYRVFWWPHISIKQNGELILYLLCAWAGRVKSEKKRDKHIAMTSKLKIGRINITIIVLRYFGLAQESQQSSDRIKRKVRQTYTVKTIYQT